MIALDHGARATCKGNALDFAVRDAGTHLPGHPDGAGPHNKAGVGANGTDDDLGDDLIHEPKL